MNASYQQGNLMLDVLFHHILTLGQILLYASELFKEKKGEMENAMLLNGLNLLERQKIWFLNLYWEVIFPLFSLHLLRCAEWYKMLFGSTAADCAVCHFMWSLLSWELTWTPTRERDHALVWLPFFAYSLPSLDPSLFYFSVHHFFSSGQKNACLSILVCKAPFQWWTKGQPSRIECVVSCNITGGSRGDLKMGASLWQLFGPPGHWTSCLRESQIRGSNKAGITSLWDLMDHTGSGQLLGYHTVALLAFSWISFFRCLHFRRVFSLKHRWT